MDYANVVYSDRNPRIVPFNAGSSGGIREAFCRPQSGQRRRRYMHYSGRRTLFGCRPSDWGCDLRRRKRHILSRVLAGSLNRQR